MRTLAQVSSNIITTQDNLTFPIDNLTFNGNITSNGNINTTGNIKITGDLEVDGNVNFKNKDSKLMEIYPKYMIIFFNSGQPIPLGWAPCNGRKYSININKTPSSPNNYIENINGTQTPDLSQIEKILVSEQIVNTPPLIMKIT
jgi:hypothetical protein